MEELEDLDAWILAEIYYLSRIVIDYKYFNYQYPKDYKFTNKQIEKINSYDFEVSSLMKKKSDDLFNC